MRKRLKVKISGQETVGRKQCGSMNYWPTPSFQFCKISVVFFFYYPVSSCGRFINHDNFPNVFFFKIFQLYIQLVH